MIGGRLRDLIRIQVRSVTTDANGQSDISWTAGEFREWADAERTTEQNATFIIRYRSDIGPESHRIIWDGSIWTIVSAVHDRKRTMLTISSDFSDAIEVTNFQSTEREFIDGLPVVNL